MNGVVLFKDIFAGKVNFTDLAHFFSISLVLRKFNLFLVFMHEDD